MTELFTLAPAILSTLANSSVTFAQKVEDGTIFDEDAFSTSLRKESVVFETEDVEPGTVCFVSEDTSKALSEIG